MAPHGSSFGPAALAALKNNDFEAVKAAFNGRKAADINVKVTSGSYDCCKDLDDLKYEEGDTLLHLALRNQKWQVWRACTAELNADATCMNAAGETPPGLQIMMSLPRCLAGIVWVLAVHYGLDYVDLSMFNVPDFAPVLLFWLAVFFTLAGVVDLGLALRWHVLAHYRKVSDGYRAAGRLGKDGEYILNPTNPKKEAKQGNPKKKK